MADLKLNGITPDGVGKIKLGSVDVQEIYMGSTLVWPTSTPPGPDPETVNICNLIWTTTNSIETELIAGGNIPICTTTAEMQTKDQQQLPAACYWNFDANESYRGLYYNIHARSLVKPPSGFRLPTPTDYNIIAASPCNPNSPNQNRYGAPLPNNYDPNVLTDTSFLGATGFNAYGYGGGRVLSAFPTRFSQDGIEAVFWTSGPGTRGGMARVLIGILPVNSYLRFSNTQESTDEIASLRFCKDA